MSMLPSVQEIEALHHKYASNQAMFEWVYVHCQAVWSVAEQLIDQNNIPVDRDLVQVGCLLHDIGVYTLFDDVGKLHQGKQYITHGIRGSEILSNEGFNETIQRFASNHTGVGLRKTDIVEHHLPLPPQDFLAETIEERLVMYADKFHSKEEPLCFNSYEWYKKFAEKFGQDKVVAFEDLAAEFGIPDVEKLADQHDQAVRSIDKNAL